MTPEQKQIAVAKLDGVAVEKNQKWRWLSKDGGSISPEINRAELSDDELISRFCKIPYLTSRDAIIPVIEKQTSEIQWEIVKRVEVGFHDYWSPHCLFRLMTASAEQLVDALLKATGQYVD